MTSSNKSQWNEAIVKDLIGKSKLNSNSEVAKFLTEKYVIKFNEDMVRNKLRRLGLSAAKNKKENKIVKNRDYFDKTQDDSKKSKNKVYLVTGIIAGCDINKQFFKSIQWFLKDRDAKLICLPMRGLRRDDEFSDSVLNELSESIYTNFIFNSNLEAFDLNLHPNQILPLTGTSRLAQKKSSLIIASPKQSLETIPVANSIISLPHILVSTGALTEPFKGKTRIGMLGVNDHCLGALVVEIKDDYIFHIRQIQFINGYFCDLNKKYSPNGTEIINAEAFVLGDIHCGSEDEQAVKASWEQIDYLKPKHIFCHDLFDSRSINHHTENNLYARVNLPDKFKLLKSELDNLVEFLVQWTKRFPKSIFYVVESNHNLWLSKYLDQGKFVFDHHNARVSADLFIYRLDGFNPIQKYVESKVKLNNVIWLKQDDDFKVAGIQLAAHGHLGVSGSRGSLTGLEKAFGKCVIGHSHSPKILRGAYQVGTITKLKLEYNQGHPSNWLHASTSIYKDGQRQMIIMVNGEWKL